MKEHIILLTGVGQRMPTAIVLKNGNIDTRVIGLSPDGTITFERTRNTVLLLCLFFMREFSNRGRLRNYD